MKFRSKTEEAHTAAVRIFDRMRTGHVFPVIKTLQILEKAWLEGYERAKELEKREKQSKRKQVL